MQYTQGLKYPVSAVGGGLELAVDPAKEAVQSAIFTAIGERVLRASYGQDLEIFDLAEDLGEMAAELEEAIIASCADYEISDVSVSARSIGDDGQIFFDVFYSASSVADSLVINYLRDY